LVDLEHTDLDALAEPPAAGARCLVDVTSPLLGPAGAAAVFGPQKGATGEDIDLLERGLARLATLLGGDPQEPGSGPAGGAAYGLRAAWGAELVPGAATVAQIASVPEALKTADLLVTGEGPEGKRRVPERDRHVPRQRRHDQRGRHAPTGRRLLQGPIPRCPSRQPTGPTPLTPITEPFYGWTSQWSRPRLWVPKNSSEPVTWPFVPQSDQLPGVV
jgi:hypothetical protein